MPHIPKFARHGVAAGAIGASLMIANAPAQPLNPPLVQIERPAQSGPGLARISGYVTDPNGAAIPYALVSITNQETLMSFVQNATAEGFYEFKDLDAGKYKIRFEAGGFAFKEIDEVYIGDASEFRRDGQLALNSVTEAVEVKTGDQVDQYVTVGVVGIDYDMGQRNELVTAVLNGDFDEVKARIIMGARINVRDKTRDGMSPLHAAVESGKLEIVEYLLDHGAKANIRDSGKRTPVMMLDDGADVEDGVLLAIFQALVRHGAKPTLLDKQKNTVLHHLAYDSVDDEELTRAILSFGVNPNTVNKQSKTALMIAVDNVNLDMVEVLLQSGADVNIRDREGKTALDYAGDQLVQTRTLLQSYGATGGTR